MVKFNANRLAKEATRRVYVRLNSAIKRAKGTIESNIKREITRRIRLSPEYESLTDTNGQLRGDFGVVDGDIAMDEVIRTIQSEVFVRIPTGNLGFKIIVTASAGISAIDMARIADLPSTSFVSENGYAVDWMKWLLFEGSNIVVANYRSDWNPGNSDLELISRTGLAVMREGGSFQVPPQFAGFANDNFLTRSLDGMNKFIENQLKKHI